MSGDYCNCFATVELCESANNQNACQALQGGQGGAYCIDGFYVPVSGGDPSGRRNSSLSPLSLLSVVLSLCALLAAVFCAAFVVRRKRAVQLRAGLHPCCVLAE